MGRRSVRLLNRDFLSKKQTKGTIWEEAIKAPRKRLMILYHSSIQVISLLLTVMEREDWNLKADRWGLKVDEADAKRRKRVIAEGQFYSNSYRRSDLDEGFQHYLGGTFAITISLKNLRSSTKKIQI